MKAFAKYHFLYTVLSGTLLLVFSFTGLYAQESQSIPNHSAVLEHSLKNDYSSEIYTDIPNETYAFAPKANDKEQILIRVPKMHHKKRILTNSLVIVGASVVSMGVLYALPESVTNWDEEARQLSNLTSKWRNNVRKGPVMDEDDFFLNWVMHPYFGAVYYMAMRGAGYNWKASFLFSAIASSLYWEYGVEALAEVPSLQDLIITPVVGSMLGEGFFWAKKQIKNSDDRVLGSLALGRTSLFLMDPLNEVYDIFLRKKIRKKHQNRTVISSFILPSSRGLAFGFSYQF